MNREQYLSAILSVCNSLSAENIEKVIVVVKALKAQEEIERNK